MLQTGFGKQGGRLVLGEEAWAGRKPQETRAEGKRCVVWKRWLNLGDRNEVLMLESYRKMRLIFYANRAAQFTRNPAECGWHHFFLTGVPPQPDQISSNTSSSTPPVGFQMRSHQWIWAKAGFSTIHLFLFIMYFIFSAHLLAFVCMKL